MLQNDGYDQRRQDTRETRRWARRSNRRMALKSTYSAQAAVQLIQCAFCSTTR